MNELLLLLEQIMNGSRFGQQLIWLILALFALACLILVKNIILIFREKQLLNKAKHKFKKDSESQQSVSQVVENLLKEIPESAVHRRINTLFRIRQIHSISTDLLERMDYLEEQKHYSFIRFVTNILLILGLLGTVFGLSIAVRNIVPAIQDAQNLADVTTLVNALSQTMGGLHTAFNTTMVALGCTFILAMFVQIAQRYERRFICDLEYFSTYELMPKILISAEADANMLYVEAIEKSANDIARAADVLDKSRSGIEAVVGGLVRATTTSEDRIVDFFNFAQTFQESVGRLMEYKDDIHKTYNKIATVLKEIKENQLSDKLIGEIVDKSVARSMAATQEAAEKVRATFREDIAKIEQGQERFIKGVQSVASAINNVNKENAAALTSSANQAFKEALGIFRQELDSLSKREDISRMVASNATDNFRQFVDSSIASNKATQKAIETAVAAFIEAPTGGNGGKSKGQHP